MALDFASLFLATIKERECASQCRFMMMMMMMVMKMKTDMDRDRNASHSSKPSSPCR